MCFAGAALIGPVMGVMGQMAGFASQQQQYAAKEQQYVQNFADALQDNRDNEEALTQREMQENQSYSDKDHQALIEGAEKEAQVRVAAATNNVAGITPQQIAMDVGQQIDAKRSALQTNWQDTATQLQSQKDTDVVQEMSRINQVAPPYSPSPMGAIAGSIGDLAGGAAKMPGGMFGTPSPSGSLSTPAPTDTSQDTADLTGS